jgi:hypothetical protein
MQRAAQRVIVGNEGLDLTTPMSQHEFLLRAVPDLDRGAIERSANHVAEEGIGGHGHL